MEPSVEVAMIILLVVVLHFLVYYLLTRKSKNIEGACHTRFIIYMYIYIPYNSIYVS